MNLKLAMCFIHCKHSIILFPQVSYSEGALCFSSLNAKKVLEILKDNSNIILSIPFNLKIHSLNYYEFTKWHHY